MPPHPVGRLSCIDARCAAALVAAALLLLVSFTTWPIDHDEGQYVAATAFMRGGIPYRDFPYLQTPLQPLVLAPLSFLPAGWLFAGSRAANALFAWTAIALLMTSLHGRARPLAILVASLAMASTNVFLFAGSVARNDALPLALLGGAIAFLLPTQWGGRWRHFLAGVLLGLAISAKINFALPAAGAGLYLLFDARQSGWRPALLCALGGLLGLLPTLVLAIMAPHNFYFDVFTYSLSAPQQWWVAVGKPEWLDPPFKLWRLLKFASIGSILPALVIAAIDRRRSPTLLLLDCMIVGALVAAYLPDPTFRQYLTPLLPPLFVRFAFALDTLSARARLPVIMLTAAASLVGLTPILANVVEAWRNGSELGQAMTQGRTVAKLAAGDLVVTLSPGRVAGADVRLDRRFATGPFLFRTHGDLSRDALRFGGSPNWQRLHLLDEHPPAVILVGGENEPHPPLHGAGLDGFLASWAKSRGYREYGLKGGFTIYAVRRPTRAKKA